MQYELRPIYDGKKSFYGKAIIISDDKSIKLKSYNTIVAEIIDGKPKVYGSYSVTTLRHIKEFLKQNHFKAESQQQILKDYSPTKEEREQEEKEQEEKAKSFFNSVKMICAVGEILEPTQQAKNDFKKRILTAGLENRGLSFPDDWESLSEEEKKKRLDNAINVL